MKTINLYQINGFANRREYLYSLSKKYGIPYSQVLEIADFLGEKEDFKSLIAILDDMVNPVSDYELMMDNNYQLSYIY